MSHIDEATENPNDKMPKGKPLNPDVVVPEDDAGLDEDEVEGDDQPAEGRRREGSVSEAFGIDERHLHHPASETREPDRAVRRLD